MTGEQLEQQTRNMTKQKKQEIIKRYSDKLNDYWKMKGV